MANISDVVVASAETVPVTARRAPRRRLRRLGVLCFLAGAALWLASEFLVGATCYADRVTLRIDRGYAAAWLGGDRTARNSAVLNNFEYPFYPGRGTGMLWTPDWGNELDGPASLCSADALRYAAQYPRRGLGLWWPRAWARSGYVCLGLPFWTLAAAGAVMLGADRLLPRRLNPNACGRCGYDLTGIDGMCPECGGMR